jgi:hypothetical protein
MLLYKEGFGSTYWVDENSPLLSKPAIKKTFPAGATVSSGMALMIDVDGKAYPFDILNSYHYNKYLGVADTAALIDQPCEVVIDGTVTNPGTGWVAGNGYYIGPTSFPSPTPPVAGLVKQIGVGIATDSILLNGGIDVEIS